MNNQLSYIAVSSIDEGERRRKGYPNLEELKASLLAEGLIQPIAVMEQSDGRYLLLAGGRRLKAVTDLGWTEVACHVYPFTADTRKRRVIELMENIQRENLTFAEEAILTSEIHQLQVDIHGTPVSRRDPKGGQTITATAEMLGRSYRDVHRDLQIATAIKEDPNIAKAKNKSEAYAQILKAREADTIKELASRMRRRTSNTDATRAKIIEQYLHGDTIERMRGMDDESFSLAEVDPPYGIELRRVVQATDQQMDDLEAKPMDDEARAAFIANKVEVFKEVYRVLKKDAWMILWYAMEPWAEPMYQAALAAGFEGTRTPALWVKNNGKTRTPNIHLGNWFEPFMYFRKGNAMLARPGARNVFAYAMLTGKSHPNEKPIELYEELLRTFAQPSSTILSPYAGSGNILLAAANAQMDGWGIDKNTDYVEPFTLKVFADSPGQYRSYR